MGRPPRNQMGKTGMENHHPSGLAAYSDEDERCEQPSGS